MMRWLRRKTLCASGSHSFRLVAWNDHEFFEWCDDCPAERKTKWSEGAHC